MKNWISLDDQVQKHIDRGLDLGSVSRREFSLFLYTNNYYRVSGYGRCFYEPGADRYQAGMTAERLMDIYEQDRAVRILVLEGISVVEPTLRSRVAYHVAQTIGAGDGYLSESFYQPATPNPEPGDTGRWDKQITNRRIVLKNLGELQGRDEIFIQHHVRKGEPVPFWAIIEVVSMGMFSRFLRALRDKDVLTPVSRSLGIEDNNKLVQAVQNLAYLRNIAAHHGRLWNRRLDAYVTLPQIALKVKRDYLSPKTPAASLTLLAGLVDQIERGTNYSTALLDLVHSSDGYAQGCYHPIL